MARVIDSQPYLMKKESILARSGVYWYSHAEMLERGFSPKVAKERYSEYRPATVLVKCKDKFAFATVSVEHTDEETSADNFHTPGQVSGIVGDSISVVTIDEEGEVGLSGTIAFYTKDAVDYYNSGVRETSADYKSLVQVSDDPKYDLILVDIISVNGVAITERGRGGQHVRVRDSAANLFEKNGGSSMGILGVLGIKKNTETKTDEKLSKIFFDGLKKIDAIDRTKDSKKYNEAAIKLCEVVGEKINTLAHPGAKLVLQAVVKDSVGADTKDALENEAEVSEKMDSIFDRAKDKEAEDLKRTADALMENTDSEETDTEDSEEDKEKKEKKEKEDKEKKDKEAKTKDSVSLKTILDEFKKELPGLVNAQVAKALNIKSTTTKDSASDLQSALDGGSRTVDSEEIIDQEDALFLLKSNF